MRAMCDVSRLLWQRHKRPINRLRPASASGAAISIGSRADPIWPFCPQYLLSFTHCYAMLETPRGAAFSFGVVQMHNKTYDFSRHNCIVFLPSSRLYHTTKRMYAAEEGGQWNGVEKYLKPFAEREARGRMEWWIRSRTTHTSTQTCTRTRKTRVIFKATYEVIYKKPS